MSKNKVGDLRIKAYLNVHGTYVAEVQTFVGFKWLWSAVKRFEAVSLRTPDDCVRMAKAYVADQKNLKLGVITE